MGMGATRKSAMGRQRPVENRSHCGGERQPERERRARETRPAQACRAKERAVHLRVAPGRFVRAALRFAERNAASRLEEEDRCRHA